MTRQIINFPEFSEALDGLFSETSVCDIKAFEAEAAASKQRRKEKIAAVSARLRRMKAEIEKYKAQIRTAADNDNKKEYGIRLNRLILAKTELLKVYKEEKNLTPFAELSEEAKVYACTERLLKKYLLAAFVKSSPEAYRINEDGTVTLNVEHFRNSLLYQQANHLKDYVASYIRHYPHRVGGSRYFTGLHKELQEFEDIVLAADEYFETVNRQNEQNKEKLHQSREGIEVVEIYPEHNAQAVRLTTADALKYEGTEMSHCVATYCEKVKKGETEIYSIRDYGDEYVEFVPHATIEYKAGKVTQIKGYKDSLVDMAYIKDARRLVLTLLHLNNEEEIINHPDIPLSEKNNIGYMKDTHGTLRDILEVIPADADVVFSEVKLKANRIKYMDFNRLKFAQITINGDINDKTLQYLSRADNLSLLNLNFDNEQNSSVLDLSALRCQKIFLNFRKNTAAQKIILPLPAQDVCILGTAPELTAIEGTHSLQRLVIQGNYAKLAQIPAVSETLEIQATTGLQEITSHISPTFKNLLLHGAADLSDTLLPNVESLSLNGTFTLPRTLMPRLEKLKIIGNYETLETLETAPNLKDIELDGNFENFTSFPEKAEIIKLKGKFPRLETLPLFSKLKKIELNEGTFGISGTLDFTSCPDLDEIDFMQSEFPQLQEIIVPENVKNFSGSHCVYPALERIDLSASPRKGFGTLESDGKLVINLGEHENNAELDDYQITMPKIGGYLMNFSFLPALKELKLCKGVEKIHLTGMKFGVLQPLDMAKYRNLNELDLQFVDFQTRIPIDLSHCEKLKKLNMDIRHLPDIIVAPNVEALNIRNEKKTSVPQSVNLRQYPHLKTLKCDFILQREDIPPSTETLYMFLMDKASAEFRELDVAAVQEAAIRTSTHLELPQLERIALPEKFESLFLYNPMPHLTEIDLRQAKGTVEFVQMNLNWDEVSSSIGKIYLKSEQYRVLKKIRIGKKTELQLPESVAALPITIEVPKDMPADKVQEIKTKYPRLTIVREEQKLLPLPRTIQQQIGAGRL